MLSPRNLLILILVIAAVLRLWGLPRGDTITDEVLYAFRAIGPMDFDEGEDQTTPLEWFDERGTGDRAGIPWWTSLSFHDHPSLVFWIQHFSMRIFGETNFGFRLPSAVFGVASVYLLYLIGTVLHSRTVGLMSALLLAVTVNHIYISRAGLQEAYVIFFILLASYFFLRSLKKDTYLIWTGVILGLALLTKYTIFLLVPIFLVYLIIFKREYFLNKKLWIGAVLALAIFSPVIIYNYKLYQRVGHFDFQFSYIFGQNPDIWKIAPGKAVGTLADRVWRFIPTLVKINSWLFLSLFATALAVFCASVFKKPRRVFRAHGYLIIIFFFFIALILRIGPSYRFLTMLTPWAALAIGYFLLRWNQKVLRVLAALVFVFEALYSINTQILYYPRGAEAWAFAGGARSENYNWGFNELADYLEVELRGKIPAVAFTMRYEFLDRLHNEATTRASVQKLRPYSAVIIYDGNIQNMAQLWVLDRLNIYHAWPVLKTEQYIEFMGANNIKDIATAGFDHYYFIIPNDRMPHKNAAHYTQMGRAFERELVARGLKPVSITNKRDEEAFRVYKF